MRGRDIVQGVWDVIEAGAPTRRNDDIQNNG
jgi:hypothetical protein